MTIFIPLLVVKARERETRSTRSGKERRGWVSVVTLYFLWTVVILVQSHRKVDISVMEVIQDYLLVHFTKSKLTLRITPNFML